MKIGSVSIYISIRCHCVDLEEAGRQQDRYKEKRIEIKEINKTEDCIFLWALYSFLKKFEFLEINEQKKSILKHKIINVGSKIICILLWIQKKILGNFRYEKKK